MSAGTIRAEFIASAGGRVLTLARVPERILRPAVLIAPPFGEEMNKCRRMVTELSRRLLQSGQPTVLVDLRGTGDSEAGFDTARWAGWVEDLQAAARWAGVCGFPVGSLLGIRLGCLLAMEAAPRIHPQPRHLIFWQPVASGRRFLDQFLRLGVAAALARGQVTSSVADFRRRLHSGTSVEIAGYVLTPELAADIDGAEMNASRLSGYSRVDWLELVQGEPPELPVASLNLIDSARAAAATVDGCALRGMPYWAATETVVDTALLDRTVDCLAAGPA